MTLLQSISSTLNGHIVVVTEFAFTVRGGRQHLHRPKHTDFRLRIITVRILGRWLETENIVLEVAVGNLIRYCFCIVQPGEYVF